LNECGDTLQGHDGANLEAGIGCVWSCTWRPYLSEFGESLGGGDQARLDMYLDVGGGRHVRCCDTIDQFDSSQPWECDKATSSLSSHGELADGGRSCRDGRWKLN